MLAAGVRYLRVEGAFYAGIGCLFLLYGFYRAVKRPGMSVVLTVISLGTRVALAYALAGTLGEVGIWAAIPSAGRWPTSRVSAIICSAGRSSSAEWKKRKYEKPARPNFGPRRLRV